MNRFERFCYRYDRWGIPHLMLLIVICNAVVYCITMLLQTTVLIQGMAFSRAAILSGQVWRLITFVFIPPSLGNVFFAAIALYFYYMLGQVLELEWGRLKFNIYYVSGMVCTIIYCLLTGASADATYVNLSLFFAYATLFPENRIMLFFFIPIKVKYLGYVSAGLFLWGIISPSILYGTITFQQFFPLAALLNYVVFFWPVIRRVFKIRSSRKRAYDFKSAVRRSRSRPGYDGYVHKCASCGVTDTQNPDMEFRYCSLCAHYECYCTQHIFNHEHTKN